MRDHVELASSRRVTRVFVSALTGEGLDLLREVIKEAIVGGADAALKRADAAPPVGAPDDVAASAGTPSEAWATGTYHSRA
jgi:50S ribosomal subunit-associated GTPase HflX